VLVARRAELLDEVAAGIRQRGGEALPVPSDLAKEEAVTALFARVMKTYGRLDVLVNNAGRRDPHQHRGHLAQILERGCSTIKTSPPRSCAAAKRSAS